MPGRGTQARGGTRAAAKPPYIFDAWAIVAWLTGERPAAVVVRKALKEASTKHRAAAMCLINLGEVYYVIGRESGVQDAERARRRLLEEAPIRFEPARQDLVFRAAKLKMKYSFSYADAVAAALALKLKGCLLTGDTEMQKLEAAEGLKIKWLTREEG
jgi:predicted nucleic acid-binding protein